MPKMQDNLVFYCQFKDHRRDESYKSYSIKSRSFVGYEKTFAQLAWVAGTY